LREKGRKGEREKGRKGEREKGRKGEREKGRKGEREKGRKGIISLTSWAPRDGVFRENSGARLRSTFSLSRTN